jgi:hypothetical protein
MLEGVDVTEGLDNRKSRLVDPYFVCPEFEFGTEDRLDDFIYIRVLCLAGKFCDDTAENWINIFLILS